MEAFAKIDKALFLRTKKCILTANELFAERKLIAILAIPCIMERT